MCSIISLYFSLVPLSAGEASLLISFETISNADDADADRFCVGTLATAVAVTGSKFTAGEDDVATVVLKDPKGETAVEVNAPATALQTAVTSAEGFPSPPSSLPLPQPPLLLLLLRNKTTRCTTVASLALSTPIAAAVPVIAFSAWSSRIIAIYFSSSRKKQLNRL
jgi:hypothetical protein